ncbi:hypothetical protein [Fusobacterium massiliense]|jgi:hypothetical protein|uniref:hypothetical protein n=1 Tax=Fusobacterium massiliense TaxID=1852365 RepID=UPI00093CA5DE|nr:hypothetical protein [Fusobacterium massiliense]
MKYIIFFFTIIVVGFWVYNPITLNKVSKAEKDLKIANDTLEELQKELDRKMIYYDTKLDLSAIKLEMESKGFSMADNIIYFEIED